MGSKCKTSGKSQTTPSKGKWKKEAENTNCATSSETATASTTPASSSSRPPIFFFKEDEIPNGYLCQWYRWHFKDPNSGLSFNCAEQWMMYQKAMLSNDTAIAAEIMKCTSPRKQKALGREVSDFDKEKWNAVRLEIVERGNYMKFTQATNAASIRMGDTGEPKLSKDLLLATRDRELVEASPFDRVWGIGFKASEALSQPRGRWGENLLGKALVTVRKRLVKEAEAAASTTGQTVQ